MDILQLLTFAIDNGAEGVLVSAGTPPILQVKGKLVFTKMDPLGPHDTRTLIYSVLDDAQVEALEREQDLDFTFELRDKGRFMGSAYWQRGAISAVFRVAPGKLGVPSFVVEAARAHHGLVVIAAPPGHGKSTALGSLVELINAEREGVVLMLEERITYPHADKKCIVHQREVGRDTQSFHRALSTTASLDPSVLVVDPLVDAESIRKTLDFAGRGRLVLASIDAETVPEALDRLMGVEEGEDDAGPSPRRCRHLAAVLTMVAAMRLLPKKNESGRVPASELLKVDASVARVIRDGDRRRIRELMKTPDDSGIWAMDSFIMKLRERGLVDDDTARRYIADPELLDA